MDQLGIFLKFSVLALAISAAISQYRSGGGHQVLNHIQKQSVDMAQMTPAHGKVPPPSSSSSLRILCLGDSLTAGYTNWGMSFFPYSDTLTERLKDSLLSTDVHVDVDGFSGDQVRGQFVKRMQRSCEKAKANPYDWIIVLGGTNDLGWGQKPPEIFEGLSTFYVSCPPSVHCPASLCTKTKKIAGLGSHYVKNRPSSTYVCGKRETVAACSGGGVPTSCDRHT